eukprot:COSAG05_NODE_4338_length_1560_cov_2.013005_1_plen_258_part_00
MSPPELQPGAVPIVKVHVAEESLQLAERTKGGDDDDDASMGAIMRLFGLVHSVAEVLHVLTCTFGVWLWGMATVGFMTISSQCDDPKYKDVKARCFGDIDKEAAKLSKDHQSGCPKPGISMNRLCDLVDGALTTLNLALGPHVLVMTVLVMFTAVQVAMHSCCFGETEKKGAAFTYMLFCIIGALFSLWTMIEGYVLVEDLKEIANDMGAKESQTENAQDEMAKKFIDAAEDSPVIQFFIFTSFVTFVLRLDVRRLA